MTYKTERWILTDLLPPAGSKDMKAVLDLVDKHLEEFETLRERLNDSITETDFLDLLKRFEQLETNASTLMAYSYLWFSEDTTEQAALSFKAQMQQKVVEIGNRTLFFTLWWKALDDAAAEKLIANSGDPSYYLESLRRFKPHTLSEAEERIINIKNSNGIDANLTIYDMITSRFNFYFDVDGEKKTLTRGQLGSYAANPDPKLRAASYQELYRVYGKNTDVLAEIYATRVRDWTEENVKVRNFPSPISVRNLGNNIPDAVIDTMLEVIRKNVSLFQRFFRFKAKALGVEKLRRYDIYAPLSESEKEYTFDEAVKIVDESYRAFSPVLADKAKQVLDTQHLDSQTRQRKLSGAYCYGVRPDLVPWVLVNFDGKVRDVSTLAHELGHAVHSLMASEHSQLTFHSALPLAETASVFGEMLLTDKLLAEEKNPALRRTLLSAFIDDAYATITRQAFFVLFEKTAHEMILAGATPDELNAAYLENLKEQFDDAMEISDEFRLEWTAIPHIYHTPFYCYAYAFGNMLVLALYRKYKEVGRDAFVPQYLRILSHGGSASPDFIVSEAGFDMASPEFWQGGFDLLADMLDELESLA